MGAAEKPWGDCPVKEAAYEEWTPVPLVKCGVLEGL